MVADFLHLARSVRRSPASAVAAILTLSMTLGADAATFAVVDAVILTPPPFTNPDALVAIGETPLDEPAGAPRTIASVTLEAWRDRARSLATIEAFDPTNLTLTGIGAAQRTSITDVTPGFLALLGVTPVLGRGFADDDVGRPVAIVSDAFWRGKLGADPGVVGGEIVLGGQTHSIVGVLPGRFIFALDRGDIWRPLQVAPTQAARAGVRVRVIARLAANVSPTSLATALDEVSRTSSPAGTRHRNEGGHGDRRPGDDHAQPARWRCRACRAHRLHQSGRPSERALDRSRTRAGSEDGARCAPIGYRPSVAAGKLRSSSRSGRSAVCCWRYG